MILLIGNKYYLEVNRNSDLMKGETTLAVNVVVSMISRQICKQFTQQYTPSVRKMKKISYIQ
jgi:hypothetical protein